ncbi:MAG: carbohydrate ABC transporter permease [Oscillospiraceae bacterium]|jgi:multiple sugar transport system permease protein|nr:carbohydrate ABC transporter permease [Oscillospiraceae bacterium]
MDLSVKPVKSLNTPVKRSAQLTALFYTVLKMILLCALGIFTAFPFMWMAVSALKTKPELMDVSLFLPRSPQWNNLYEVLFRSPLPRYIFNSLFVSAVTVAYQVVSGAMFAYAAVFMRFKGKKALFAVTLGCYMVPGAATYIPCYIILSKMGLLDTYTGLIVSNLVSIFGIFLLRQAFAQLPREFTEAAALDRAGHWRTLWRVVFPMTRPTFLSFILISFIGCYNNYMWPALITNRPELSLVSQGLRRFFIEGGAYGTNWPLVMAGSALIIVPLLVLFAVLQKHFIAGLSADAGIKG